MTLRLWVCLTTILAAAALDIQSEPNTLVYKPVRRPFSEKLLEHLKAPRGFHVNVFAKDLVNPRMLAVADDGAVYVTERQKGEVTLLRDTDGDGRADIIKPLLKLPNAHGVEVEGDKLFVATVREVYVSQLLPNGSVSAPAMLAGNLPEGGRHPNRSLYMGPDGFLYVTVGSSCDQCMEANSEQAAILRLSTDGKRREIFAAGLRNTISIDWHPKTGELWGMDIGTDDKGNDLPPEELNKLVENGFYGWPYIIEDRKLDASWPEIQKQMKSGRNLSDYVERSISPVLTYQAHSSPIGFIFYTGDQFPPEFKGDAFVTMRGSWNRYPPVGFKLVRVKFQDGRPTTFEDFLTGFLIDDGKAQFGRLAGIAQAKDGSILFADDQNGIVYRLFYTGAERNS